jgi:hypothetical protein
VPFKKEQLGCTIGSAEKVQKYLLEKKGRRKFEEIHKNLEVLPWRCLVSCPRILRQYPGVSCHIDSEVASIAPSPFPAPKVHSKLPDDIASKQGDVTRPGHFQKAASETQEKADFSPRYTAVIDIECGREASARQ